MPKRKSRGRERPAPTQPHRAPRRARLVAAALLVALAASGAAVSRLNSVRTPLGLSPAATSPAAQATPTPLAWSKDYVYAGGRLVATEEPKSGKLNCSTPRCLNNGLSKPQTLKATPSTDALQEIDVSWGAAAGGVTYEVERAASINGPFTPVATATGTNVTDTGLGACAAYIYRARTVDEHGDYSDWSNIDLATTCMFSQDPLVPRGTVIYGLHLEELRLAVEAVRRLAYPGQPAPQWTDAPLQGKRIRAVHVEELRERLVEALAALAAHGLPAPPAYAEPGALSGLTVKAAHVRELRDRVK